MHYVGNNHIAFDQQSLAFPSIKGCQAVCFHAHGGLYGFHDYKGAGGAGVDSEKAAAFAAWAGINGTGDITQGQALYGVINQEHQYSRDTAGEQAWQTMLLGVATALNFTGPIYGVRITSHVGKSDSLYVRCDLAGGQVQISWKRWSKMESAGNELNPDDQALLRPAKSAEIDPSLIRADTRPYVAESVKDNEYQPVHAVRRRDQTKGQNLHIVATKKIVQFR
jgi:hypothetical protein